MDEEKKKDVRAFAEELADAYSSGSYRGGWSGCIRALRRRGLDDRQIEAVIRSKWTRWAGDASDHAYGRVTAGDLVRYMDRAGGFDPKELSKLVAGTFGEVE